MVSLRNNELPITVIPKRVIFQTFNEEDESSFSVLACDVVEKGVVKLNKYGNITITGDNLMDLQIDVPTLTYLSPSVNSKYPDGYTARIPVDDIPETAKGQWDFLRSVLGITTTENFKKVYNDDVKIVDFLFDELNRNEIIANVKGVGEKTYKSFIKQLKSKSEYAKTYAFLSDYGMTDSLILKIYRKYNVFKVIKNIVEKDIFRLTEINGIGFKRIDEIYLKQEGARKEDEKRIVSGLEYYISENQQNGNTRIEKRKLEQGSQLILDVNIDYIRRMVQLRTFHVRKDNIFDIMSRAQEDETLFSGKIIEFQGKYSTASTFMTEWNVFRELTGRSCRKADIAVADMDSIIKKFGDKSGFYLSEEQSNFFRNLFNSEISFLLGSSGSGKSSAQAVLLEYTKETNQSVLFLAPTGMARKRITEVTGNVAYTIHSFIRSTKLSEQSFDIYLIDEASMIDVELAEKLLKAIPMGKKIIFVGDGSQIPSVSFGNFLYDCTNNSIVKIDRFTKVFRQSEGGILDIVTKIRQGEQFLPSTFNSRKVFGNNCVFDMSMARNEKPIDKVLTAYKNTIKTGKYTEDDIVVLSPTKKGKNGTVAINNSIQSFINPHKSFNEFRSVTDGIDVVFREGDRILNKKNRKDVPLYYKTSGGIYVYSKKKIDIVNGDIGHIIAIEGKSVYAKFDDSILLFSMSDFNNQSIIHGWAITGHKSQGSEFKVVICLFERSSKFQMNGNLLYTMTSRAKELLLVLGDISTINSSLKKFENTSRETNLLDFFNLKNK